MIISKTAYLHGFTFTVLILGIVRLILSISDGKDVNPQEKGDAAASDSKPENSVVIPSPQKESGQIAPETRKPHRILSVRRFDEAFPDANDVQLLSARKWGVKPVANTEEAEKRKNELVYIGASPWFHVDRLRTSIPYLVPKAAILLHDIGRTFYDSLDVKGVPLHKIIASSVLRSKEDIDKLRRQNLNATENSCHLYGTTFDICYNRYKTVEAPSGPSRRTVTNDTLKWVLSEVLRDMREAGRCYVKYEVKQGCFHITVR